MRHTRSFNPEFWPDPAEMAAKVKALTGAEMMVSLWPSMEDLSVNYLPTQMQGLLATTRDGTGVSDSFAGVYTRLSERLTRALSLDSQNSSFYRSRFHEPCCKGVSV